MKRSVILVPLDGSPEAERGVSYARALVPIDGEIILLRVAQESEALRERWEGGRLTENELRIEAETVSRRSIEPIAEQLDIAGFRVRVEVLFGNAAEEIIRYAEMEQVDVVVMTTHGRGAVGRAFFGSVADRVVRHSTRPTLLLRGGAHRTLPDRIILPLDGSTLAESAVPIAAWAARLLGTPVHLVRVIDHDEVLREIWLGDDKTLPNKPKEDAYSVSRVRCLEKAEAYLADQVATLQSLGIAATRQALTGIPAVVLLELLQSGDLVVMTTSGSGGVRRLWIGSVTEKIVREAAAPILLVHPDHSVVTAP